MREKNVSSEHKCPECGSGEWENSGYMKNATHSFLVRGRCISCGFKVDADYLLNQIREKIVDLFLDSSNSPRFNHDKSLQEETLRDYPLYADVLKYALECCKDKNDNAFQETSGILGRIYEELAWFAQNTEQTYDFFSKAQYYFSIEETKKHEADEKNYEFITFARRKANLNWWQDKVGLLKEACKIADEVEMSIYGDQSREIEWGFNIALVYQDYAVTLEDEMVAKGLYGRAIDLLKLSINCAEYVGFGYDHPLGDAFFIIKGYQKLGEIYEKLGDVKLAYIHYLAAEKYAPKWKYGEAYSLVLLEKRKKIEDKLVYGEKAEAMGMLKKGIERLDLYSHGKESDSNFSNCNERINSILNYLKSIMEKHDYDRLKDFTGNNLDYKFLAVRALVVQYERFIYKALFGELPRVKPRKWVSDLITKLEETDPYGVTFVRFLWNFACKGVHSEEGDSEKKIELTIQDLELLYLGLAWFLGWFQAFKKSNS